MNNLNLKELVLLQTEMGKFARVDGARGKIDLSRVKINEVTGKKFAYLINVSIH